MVLSICLFCHYLANEKLLLLSAADSFLPFGFFVLFVLHFSFPKTFTKNGAVVVLVTRVYCSRLRKYITNGRVHPQSALHSRAVYIKSCTSNKIFKCQFNKQCSGQESIPGPCCSKTHSSAEYSTLQLVSNSYQSSVGSFVM